MYDLPIAKVYASLMTPPTALSHSPAEVLSATEARTSLPSVLDDFRDRGMVAEPVFFGSHRRAEGVIIPVELFRELLPAIEEVLLKATVRERIAQDVESLPLDAALVESIGLDPSQFDL